MALRPRPVEWLLAGYAILIVIVSLARIGRWPGLGWIAVAHLLVLGLIALVQGPLGPAGRTLRTVAPVLLLFGLYGAIDVINGAGAAPTFDRAIQGWDQAWFGGQPARDWWRAWPSPTASAVGHAIYFCYYLIVPLPVAWFLARGRPDRAGQAVFPILAAFLLCYVGFALAPVAGPYYEFARPDPWFLANGPARLVYRVLARGSSYGAAFPSSHVAGTWAAVGALWPDAPRLAGLVAIPAGLLTVGVVYCQMHYAADAIAGILVAALAIALGRLVAPPTPT